MAIALPGSAARYRTSIGRAYYGSFHYAIQALDSMGLPIGKGPQAHGDARKLFQRSGDRDLAAAGGLLGDLHRLRIRADYHLNPMPSVETLPNAMKAATDADQIVAAIDALLNDAARRATAQAIIRSIYQQVRGLAPPSP